MHVLISIQQRVKQWQIPEAAARALMGRFPDLEFTYATTEADRASALATADVAYTWILSPAELSAAPRLRWVHTSAVAVETLCLADLSARGVRVSNTRGVQATPIAEHVFAVLLALAKQLPLVLDNQRQRRWAQNDLTGDRLPWMLRRRTLGLIGVGTIGSQVALLADSFGMHVAAVRRRPGSEQVPGVHEMLMPGELDVLLERADVLVIAAPLTPETTNLIGAPQLAPVHAVRGNVDTVRRASQLLDALEAVWRGRADRMTEILAEPNGGTP